MARGLNTPIIKPRPQGGTFYTFASAMEDVGININEGSNKIALSHYVLLDIPEFSLAGEQNGDNQFAAWFQNYALNFETCLRNRENYNFAEYKTISEKVFWKFMLSKFYNANTDGTPEEFLKHISKAFGVISAGAQRTDSYGLYNETFVQIPSSFGPMNVLFKQSPDVNFVTVSSNNNGNIESSSEDVVIPGMFDNGNTYDVDQEDGGYQVLLSLDDIKDFVEAQNSDIDIDDITYDTLAMSPLFEEEISNINTYNFNAVLIYYSIFDNSNNIIATNAYGILLPNSAVPSNNGKWIFPEIEKHKTTNGKIGNSYSFRLNVKTSSVYSDTLTILDNSTPAYEMSTEFTDVVSNLTKAIELLQSNANVIRVLSTNNASLKRAVAGIISKTDDLEKDVKVLLSRNELAEFNKVVVDGELFVEHLMLKHSAEVINGEVQPADFVNIRDFVDGKISNAVSNINNTLTQNQETINTLLARVSTLEQQLEQISSEAEENVIEE